MAYKFRCDECLGSESNPKSMIKCSKCSKTCNLLSNRSPIVYGCFEALDQQNQIDDLLLCDSCDRAYHAKCVGILELPLGRWVCADCGTCTSCFRTKVKEWVEEQISSNSMQEMLDVSEFNTSNYNKGQYCTVCLAVFYCRGLYTNAVKCSECGHLNHPGK
ncbi:Histone-lysine N-methyltransferase 2B [Thelohanellus kitauei]|uniref:Histone-lysine N-methyltransferase 2B n=1 Tax=Thelohanellus kitauei TaxID=669202 RepID=A0A0C2MNV9_THEKT|nr:Histone-lysine N-methyltransferase 2B [Thelohanellus kitauei]